MYVTSRLIKADADNLSGIVDDSGPHPASFLVQTDRHINHRQWFSYAAHALASGLIQTTVARWQETRQEGRGEGCEKEGSQGRGKEAPA